MHAQGLANRRVGRWLGLGVGKDFAHVAVKVLNAAGQDIRNPSATFPI
jgi:hypothetical protein